MERLSALDTEFLHLEDGISHMHIAGMSVFEGPPASEDEIRGLLASKLHRIPRYRQRVRTVPLEIGRPVWSDDPHFDLGYHVRSTALVEPSDREVCRLMGRLMGHELDRNRPLWEVWIVHGLPGGRWALISKVHHCMVDGIAGVGLLEALLDVDPEAPAPDEPEPWRPASEPNDRALVLDAWGGLLADVGEVVRSVPDRVRDPRHTAAAMVGTTQGLVGLALALRSTPRVSVDGSIGPHRTWAHATASIDDVRRIRKTFGGTLNDVVLTVVTKGYRALLVARGDDPRTAALRTLVPVSQRHDDGTGVLDNRVSGILYDLPVGEADPITRLTMVQRQMAALKHSHMAEATDVVTSAADLLPPMLVGATTRAAMRLVRDHPQRMVNTVTTNVPGPQFPLYCLGREMLEHRPFVPISHGLRVGTAILSYNGRLSFGVTGDLETAPDVSIVADGIAAGFEELLERAQ